MKIRGRAEKGVCSNCALTTWNEFSRGQTTLWKVLELEPSSQWHCTDWGIIILPCLGKTQFFPVYQHIINNSILLDSQNGHFINSRYTAWRVSNSRSWWDGLGNDVHRGPWLFGQRMLKSSLHVTSTVLHPTQGQMCSKREPFLNVLRLAKAQVCYEWGGWRERWRMQAKVGCRHQGTRQRKDSQNPLHAKKCMCCPREHQWLVGIKKKRQS